MDSELERMMDAQAAAAVAPRWLCSLYYLIERSGHTVRHMWDRTEPIDSGELALKIARQVVAADRRYPADTVERVRLLRWSCERVR